MERWEMVRVRYGEEKKYLEDGWEPFAATAEITTNNYRDSINGRAIMEMKSNDYIYLRRLYCL